MLPITPEIAALSVALGLHGDPADRIIAATARAFGQTLITRDGELLPYAKAGYLAAINC